MVLLGQDMEVVAFTPEQVRAISDVLAVRHDRCCGRSQTIRSSRWVSPSPRTNIRGVSGMKALAPDEPMSAVGAQNLLNRVSASGAEQTSIPHAHNAQFPPFPAIRGGDWAMPQIPPRDGTA